jgi:hypothetical protein
VHAAGPQVTSVRVNPGKGRLEDEVDAGGDGGAAGREGEIGTAERGGDGRAAG